MFSITADSYFDIPLAGKTTLRILGVVEYRKCVVSQLETTRWEIENGELDSAWLETLNK